MLADQNLCICFHAHVWLGHFLKVLSLIKSEKSFRLHFSRIPFFSIQTKVRHFEVDKGQTWNRSVYIDITNVTQCCLLASLVAETFTSNVFKLAVDLTEDFDAHVEHLAVNLKEESLLRVNI